LTAKVSFLETKSSQDDREKQSLEVELQKLTEEVKERTDELEQRLEGMTKLISRNE